LEGLKVKTEIVSILALAWLESLALIEGMDGGLFTTVIAVIGGIGGYHIGKTRKGKR
jgi:hypothetical protein